MAENGGVLACTITIVRQVINLDYSPLSLFAYCLWLPLQIANILSRIRRRCQGFLQKVIRNFGRSFIFLIIGSLVSVGKFLELITHSLLLCQGFSPDCIIAVLQDDIGHQIGELAGFDGIQLPG